MVGLGRARLGSIRWDQVGCGIGWDRAGYQSTD